MSWRFNWALKEILDTSNFSKHRESLESSTTFWLALAMKLIPGVWKAPIPLRLRSGGVFDVSEFMTLYIYKEIFVDGCYDYPQLPGSEPRIIDVGANTGLFAIRMKQLYPQARIHCYEPMPRNFEQLKNNLMKSAFDNCEVFQQGVGGTTREEKLFIHNRNVGGHSIYAAVANDGKPIEITLVDIRTALDRLDGEKCTLLKLDCEGAEYEIIQSLDAATACRIERIVFEPTPKIYSIDVLKRHLEAIGYRVEWRNGIYAAVHCNLLVPA